jgi:AcrR family transcriptional regulator
MVSIAPPKSPRADAVRNRQRVLAAARETFATEGSDAQMEAVARRAGVGVGTVYRHFPTKEALIEALWADKRERIVALTQDALANPDPWGGVVQMFEQGMATMVDDLCWCQAFAQPTGCISEGDAPPDLVEAANALLQRAKAADQLREDFTFDDVGRIFSALGAVVTAHGPAASEHLLRVILDGLRRAGTARGREAT